MTKSQNRFSFQIVVVVALLLGLVELEGAATNDKFESVLSVCSGWKYDNDL